MGKIPEERYDVNRLHYTALLLFLSLAQVTYAWPIRSVRATSSCNEACYSAAEMYCKVLFGGHVATCAKCKVPCLSSRHEEQMECAEFCKESEFYTSTEALLEGRIPTDSIHRMSTLSPISEGPSTNTFTLVQTTNVLTSLEMQTTMANLKNSSTTANTTNEVRGQHGRKNRIHVGNVCTFLLSCFAVLLLSSLVIFIVVTVAQAIGKKCNASCPKQRPKRPAQNNGGAYKFVPLSPLSQQNGGSCHQDQSTEQPTVTCQPQGILYQTARPSSSSTVSHQPSECTGADKTSCTCYISNSVMKNGSAKHTEGKNKPLSSTGENNCKMAMASDPASTLAAPSSLEELFTGEK